MVVIHNMVCTWNEILLSPDKEPYCISKTGIHYFTEFFLNSGSKKQDRYLSIFTNHEEENS
jgi:hypothetical protein